ncbi:hypothetical protein ANO11243_006540 [Dothideomycetidae sp. 11243]|nr:hypothetical protein ANO11243_006540 [fungal sp. No.11243]
MANLTKPKENVPAPKIQQEVPHETEEQKRKRLRKESRRSLRVTFKPDKSLVQIRYFTHDPNEEIGHDINMTRDAGDVGGEGRMFKQHKDQMDLDDDEDDVGEEDVRPYQAPSLINFDDVDPEERQRNFAPYGGGHTEPDSAERSIREQYEANTLMVFYTDPSDVPSTPKEPTGDTDSSDAAELREFGEPEARTLDRIPKSKTTGAAAVQGNQSSATPNIDIASLLAALKPQIQQNSAVPVATTQQQPPNPGFNSLQSLLASLNQPQSAAPAVPVQQQPSAAVPNVANILANLQAAPQPQYQQPPPSAPSQMNPALAAILANLQHNGASAPSATPTSSATMPPAFALPYTPSPSAAVQPAQQQGFQQGTQRHSSHQQQQQYGMPQQQPPQQQQQQQQQQQSWGSGYGSDKRFTQTCKYWALGRCQKGANCTYKHY